MKEDVLINPAALLRLKNYLGQFRADHPKAVQFVRIMSGKVTEGQYQKQGEY